MPIYEYRCRKCAGTFEAIRPLGDDGRTLACPECGAPSPEKVPSVFAAQRGGQGSPSSGFS